MPQAVVRFGSVGDTSAPLPVAIGAPPLLGITMLRAPLEELFADIGAPERG